LPLSSTTVGFRSCIIWNVSSAAALSLGEVSFLSLMLPSSFRTSWGIIHSIGSEVALLIFSWMFIFCFVVVMTKFVSSRICMVG